MMTAVAPSRARRSGWWVVAFLGLLGMGIGVVVASLLTFAWPTGVPPLEPRVEIQRWQVPEVGSDPIPFREGEFWLVHLLPGEGAHQGFGTDEHQGGLLALWWRDPHLGCTVPWRPTFPFQGTTGWFRNPCHGETYTKAGVRVFGPAPRSLDTMEVEVRADGKVIVYPERITPGVYENALRAVPYPGE